MSTVRNTRLTCQCLFSRDKSPLKLQINTYCILLLFKMNWSQMWSRATLKTTMLRRTMENLTFYFSKVVCREDNPFICNVFLCWWPVTLKLILQFWCLMKVKLLSSAVWKSVQFSSVTNIQQRLNTSLIFQDKQS